MRNRFLPEFRKALFLFFFFNYISIVNGQSDGLLWKISGKHLKDSSYLFGTIHYHCHPESVNQPVVSDAINASENVMFELDLDNIDILMGLYQQSLKSSGGSLKTLLSSSDYIIVDNVCRYYLNDSLSEFDTKSPMAMMGNLFMSEKFSGCKGTPIDLTILQIAKSSGKLISGLESFGFQDSLLNSIPLEIQAKWLVEFCADTEKSKRDFKALSDAYDAQNSEALYRLSLAISPEFDYLMDKLLTIRNQNWVTILDTRFKNGSYFIAIGAAHLGGNNGMVELLRKAGYELTPVHY